MKVNKIDVYRMIAELLEIDVDTIQEINDDEDLMKFGLTSISCIQLIVMLEDKYNFSCKDEDLFVDKVNTFSKIFSLLERY